MTTQKKTAIAEKLTVYGCMLSAILYLNGRVTNLEIDKRNCEERERRALMHSKAPSEQVYQTVKLVAVIPRKTGKEMKQKKEVG